MNTVLLILVFVLTFLLLFTLYKAGKLVIVTKKIIRKMAREANIDAMKILREVGLK